MFIKIHGFQDSNVGLIELDHSFKSKIRANEENFLTICFEANKNGSDVTYLFKDFNKLYLIN